MQKILIVILFGLGCVSVQAQKFSTISSDFSILEKDTKKDTSFVVVGKLTYDLDEDHTIYEVKFPEKRTWEFVDSVLVVYDSLEQVVRRDTIGLVNELSVFKKILKNELNDFGLEEAGFTISDVQKAETSVVMKWQPPSQIEFIKEIISRKDDNNLTGLIVIDEHGKQISKTFYEDYIYVKDIPVPTTIKSQMTGKEQIIFKELQFRNVQIN